VPVSGLTTMANYCNCYNTYADDVAATCWIAFTAVPDLTVVTVCCNRCTTYATVAAELPSKLL